MLSSLPTTGTPDRKTPANTSPLDTCLHVCQQDTRFLCLRMLKLCSKETEMPALMQRLIHYLSAFAFQPAEAPAFVALQEVSTSSPWKGARCAQSWVKECTGGLGICTAARGFARVGVAGGKDECVHMHRGKCAWVTWERIAGSMQRGICSVCVCRYKGDCTGGRAQGGW